MIGFGEGLVYIAAFFCRGVANVRVELFPGEGRAGQQGFFGVDDNRQRLILDLNGIGGVLRDRTRARYNGGTDPPLDGYAGPGLNRRLVDLAAARFVVTNSSPGQTPGLAQPALPRIAGAANVAVYENPGIRDLRVELERYPEIQEAIRTERPVIVHDVREHPLFDAIRKRWIQQAIEIKVQSAVALPVFVQGRAAGVFFLRTVQGDPQLRPQDVALANTIAQAAARVLENEARRAAIYRRQISAGVTDVLTGCASLDALDRRLRDEFERARRYTLRFALVLIDVDRLRDINDRLGHQVGDRVLAEIGAIMQREIRAPDFAARYGGDEFALILPETDAQGGRQFVERLRQVLARHTFPDLGAGTAPTLTAGVVAFPHSEVLRPEDLFTQVEAALVLGKTEAADRIGLVENA